MKNNLLSDRLIYTGESQTPTHFHLCSYTPASVTEVEEAEFAKMSELLSNKERISWLQVHGLKHTDTIREICSFFDIDFLTLQDVLNTNHPTKIEEHERYTVFILKLFHKNEEEELEEQQLCLIQGTNFLLSFFEKETTFFDDVASALRNDILRIRGKQTDYLLSVLLNSVVANYRQTILAIDEQLEDIEELLLTYTARRNIGAEIQTLRRQYMMMKKALLPLREQYLNLIHSDNPLLHKVNRAYFNDVNDHLQFVLQTVDICRETLASLVDLYLSNNDLRMNDIMKRLTIISTIFIPLTFLVGIWGMNFRGMPELNWKYGYLYAWLLMGAIAFASYLYFRKKRW
jgi:magnesium transporter